LDLKKIDQLSNEPIFDTDTDLVVNKNIWDFCACPGAGSRPKVLVPCGSTIMNVGRKKSTERD
jgi:hypothetical protein